MIAVTEVATILGSSFLAFILGLFIGLALGYSVWAVGDD